MNTLKMLLIVIGEALATPLRFFRDLAGPKSKWKHSRGLYEAFDRSKRDKSYKDHGGSRIDI